MASCTEGLVPEARARWVTKVHIYPQVVGLDFAADMLSDAESRQRQQGLPGLERFATPMRWIQVQMI